MIQLYSKAIGPWLGVGAIRRGFSEEVAFICSEYRKEMRRLHAEVHKINDLPLAPQLVNGQVRIGTQPSCTPGRVLFLWATVMGTISPHTETHTHLHIWTPRQGLHSLLPPGLWAAFYRGSNDCWWHSWCLWYLDHFINQMWHLVAALPPVSFHQCQRLFHCRPQVPAVSLK